jgi:hypothetical protein
MKSPKVGFVSLGCPKALVDSERILTQLKTEGYDVASDYDGADLVVDCFISNKYLPSPTAPFKNTSGEISIQKPPGKSCKGHKQPATQPSGICSPL